jgi:hypothetical protein
MDWLAFLGLEIVCEMGVWIYVLETRNPYLIYKLLESSTDI